MNTLLQNSLKEHLKIAEALLEKESEIIALGKRFQDCLSRGGKLIFMGNGGSASDAMHMAAEYVAKFSRERKSLPAIALSENISVITAIANDYSYDYIFARQLESLAGQKDLVIGLSTSGESKNILAAIEYCTKNRIENAVFTGAHASSLAKLGQHVFQVPSSTTARIQEAYLFVSHVICDFVEAQFTSSKDA